MRHVSDRGDGSRSRRFVRTVCAVAVVPLAIAGSWLPVAAHAAPADSGSSPTASPSASAAPPPVTITIDSLEPRVVRPKDTITLDGTIKNTSGISLNYVSVELRVSAQRITTRYDLAQDSDPSTVTGYPVYATRQSLDTLAPGEERSWHLSLAEDRIALPNSASQFGAYPIAVEARGYAADSGASVVRRMPTTVLWMPAGAQLTPTQVSWLVPLEDGIHRAEGTTFFDDQLATDLAPSGRLGQLLRATTDAKLPLTYAIDPALVDDATVMAASTSSTKPSGSGSASGSAPASSRPSASPTSTASPASTPGVTPTPSVTPTPTPSPTRYQVVAPGQKTTAGRGAAAAATWLTQLRAAVSKPGAETLALPYGDADLTALEHAGLSREIAIARSTGQAALAADLRAPSLPDVVWPVGGVIDTTTLDDLSSDLVSAVVLSDAALPPRDPNALTGVRSDLQTASGHVRAVLTDSAIDAMIADPASAGSNDRLAEQRILAETMLITEQRPGAGSSIVLVPPRMVDPSNGFLARLLQDSGSVPWLSAVGLQSVVDQPSDGVERSSLVYPDAARQAELSPSVLAPIPHDRDQLSVFAALLGSGVVEPAINAASVALLRAESSSLRTDPARSRVIISDVETGIYSRLTKVHIADPGLITLTSRKQRIPITVVNDLPNPVTVTIRLSAQNPTRLKVAPIPPLTVPKNSRQDVLVDVEARTNGRFTVVAQLMTAETVSRPYGSPVTFELNATAFGAVALAIAGAAAGVLFLIAAVRLARRARRARAQRRSGAGTGDPPTDPAADPAAQPPADVPDDVDAASS